MRSSLSLSAFDVHDDHTLKPPSKSQRKREALALQALGERLVKLKPGQLEKVPLPAELSQAVRLAQSLRQRGAHKRQLQYIGKLMRSVDAEPIQRALQELQAQSAAAKRRQRYLERLCAAFLEDDKSALAPFFEEHPDVDRPYLRQLVRDAIGEQRQDRPPQARRRLLRYLRGVLE